MKLGGTLAQSLKISNGIYKKGIIAFSEFRNLSKKLQADLEEVFATGIFYPEHTETSLDNTEKYLYVNNKGQKFESVYIPDKNRHTICVSTQSGCRMGCPFCATGKYGFYGNLSAGDIVNQLTGTPHAGKINHVVFMGMGEPMDNLDNVLKACEILTAEWGKALSARNITVSTVGITPGIRRFLAESDCNLTVSLFTPFFAERKKIVPAEKKYPVEEIIGMLRNATLKKKRRITFSYVMLHGVNDTDAHLSEMKKLFSGSGIRINLLPYHPLRNDKHVSSTAERMQYYKHQLVTSGISASIRKSRGSDISAACGLLASGL
ncbi:MAG TPA: 23S rRNA (adenine(2503)-C(2))-methyltransferase RlmN [Bacteroidales bacterium]|nr:23S rRNA (adenine(2503)-C(2))-methyltransferase RlmN [Bacteroidales bacterium]